MTTQALADKKLAFYAPAVPDKYRDNVPPYVGEVALYSAPSVDDGYGTGVSLAGVIDGREVVGRLKRGQYDKTISFECLKTRENLFNADLIVPRSSDDSKPLLLIFNDELGRSEVRIFCAQSEPGVDPALREWGEVRSRFSELQCSLFNTNEFRMRQLFG
jgi:hypothetical protein